MSNTEYWRERARILAEQAEQAGAEYTAQIDVEFEKASMRIQNELLAWHQRFADHNGISLSDAKHILNGRQLQEFRWSVDDYIKAGSSLDPKWAQALENASARVHISRLESLQLQLQQQIEVLFGNQVDQLDGLFRRVYSNGYYHTAFEMQRGFGVGWDLQSLNEKQLKTVLSSPWTTDGQTFRDRCWKNKTALVAEVKTSLTQAIIRGDHPKAAAEAIAKRMGVSKGKAMRLAMTETAYFSAVSQKDCYEELGVTYFEVVETLDIDTCDLCAEMDGRVLPMSEYEPGVTAPPFHPWCRGCTAPHVADDFGERAARDREDMVYYVPASMKYPDWKKTFVDGEAAKREPIGIKITAMQKGFVDFVKTLDEPFKSVYTYYAQHTEFAENTKIVSPFGYSIKTDQILYNPTHPAFIDFDFNTVALHELAHRYDILAVHSAQNARFQSAIQIAQDAVAESLEAFQQMLEEEDSSDFTHDIFDALAHGKLRARYGHDSDYWNKNTVSMEIFADIASLGALKHQEYKYWEKNFPKLIDVFLEMFGGALV